MSPFKPLANRVWNLNTAYIVGAGNTRFGRLEGGGPLELMAQAAHAALDDAGMNATEIDGVLCGYATTLPHLMLSTLFCERLSLQPAYAHSVQLGGATGGAMLMLARELVRAGRCRNVLVAGGENRLSCQARDSAIQTLAQVGDADFEVPNGASVPAYYALLASRYMHETGLSEADLAELVVLMRSHAAQHPDAHLREPITREQVLASKPIASPLKLLDCCPISDGAMALVVSAGRAFAEAGLQAADIDYLAIYDSFTITLAILIEETGFAPRGGSAALVRAGTFSAGGALPLNTHGGLLSFGHSGVAGGMGHVVEAYRQRAGCAGERQVGGRRRAFVHADGGVLSSHVNLIIGLEE